MIRRVKALKKLQLESLGIETQFYQKVHDLEKVYRLPHDPYCNNLMIPFRNSSHSSMKLAPNGVLWLRANMSRQMRTQSCRCCMVCRQKTLRFVSYFYIARKSQLFDKR
jgi:hypothetical protein